MTELFAYWSRVFEDGVWNKFLVRGIVGRVVEVFEGVVVNPADQEVIIITGMWRIANWVAICETWYDVIGTALFTQILNDAFFPKWHKSLQVWLNSPAVSYPEIGEWFSGWKDFFTTLGVDRVCVDTGFRTGLDMINVGVKGMHVELPARVGRGGEKKVSKSVGNARMTFKEYVEQRIGEAGGYVRPIGRSHSGSGKAVFEVATPNGRMVSVYFDEGVMFYDAEERGDAHYIPVGIEKLVLM
jgi:hypothetical protein